MAVVSPLEALGVFLLFALPLYWLVHRQLAKLSDPRYLRAHGVVVVSENALQWHSAPIGEYMGHPIWASVRFMGMEYRFDHVLQGVRERERLGPGELYIEPGLVYIAA